MKKKDDRIAIQEQESRKWHEEYERKIEEAIATRKKIELDNVKELISQANRHHQTVLIRNYIESVRATTINNDGLSEDVRNG